MPPKPKKSSNKKKPANVKPNNKKPKDVYEAHQESFMGKPALILCRKQPGPCPLLGLCNLLLLRGGGTGLLATVKRIDAKKLHAFVLDRCTEMLKADQDLDEVDRDQLQIKYQAALEKLRSSTGMDECFCSLNAYTSTIEGSKNLFNRLGITRRHAILPDPKNTLEYSTIKDESYSDVFIECSDYVDGCKEGQLYDQSYHDRMSVVKNFIWDMPKFTKYGMGLLREEAREKELFLLLLNDDLHVVHKVCQIFPNLVRAVLGCPFFPIVPKERWRIVSFGYRGRCAGYISRIMWFGLDENFDDEHPETARKLTNTFAPVNEGRASSSEHFHQKLEEEKRTDKVEIETAASQVVAETICLQIEVGTDDTQGEIVQDSRDMKVVEMKRPEIVVDPHFLRFINRRVMSFKTFTSNYRMYRIYHFKGQKFLSTSYLGRLMGKGYLVFIFDVHKSGYSWNGKFKEEDMMVELELVDGFAIGTINFFITLTAYFAFKKERGVADLERFVEFTYPRYLCQGFNQLPFYFQSFEAEIKDMPDCDDPVEELEKFHKYMADHFIVKAPLARSTLVSDVYGLCTSEIVHLDQSQPKPRYGLLDVKLTNTDHQVSLTHSSSLTKLSPGHPVQLSLSKPLEDVYFGSRVETHITGSNRITCWDLIELGRHAKQHLMEKTQENGVQQMDDPILIDLIIEQDLRGLLTQAVKLMIQKNNFEDRFESTWRLFCGSEARDGGDIIPLLIGDEDEDVKVAELDAAGMQAAARVARAKSVVTQEPEVEVAEELFAAGIQAAATVTRAESVATKKPERYIINDYEMKLTETGLKSLDGQNWILDEVIGFVYCQLQNQFMSVEDLMLVLPSRAHLLANLPKGSDPSGIFNPGNYNMFLFPVNNSEDHKRGDDGTHWSLLALRVDRSRHECIFIHHDSIRSKNLATADCLVENLGKLFPTFHSRYKQGETPQQVNGYDCGMYVICISHEIGNWYKRVKKGEKASEDWIADVNEVTHELVREDNGFLRI